MARVHKVRANKDYPQNGIAKGQQYYTWTSRPGRRGKGIVHRQLTAPTRAQLTSSAFLQEQYSIEDEIADFPVGRDANMVAFLDDIRQRIEDLKSMAEESLENMPEVLREGSSSGQLLQERIDGCEEWISTIDGESAPELDDEDYQPTEDRTQEEADEAFADAQREVLDNIACQF